jgi:hypothetical protein
MQTTLPDTSEPSWFSDPIHILIVSLSAAAFLSVVVFAGVLHITVEYVGIFYHFI